MSLDQMAIVLASNLVWQTLILGLIVAGAFQILPREAARTRYYVALGSFFGVIILLCAPFLPSLTPAMEVGVITSADFGQGETRSAGPSSLASPTTSSAQINESAKDAPGITAGRGLPLRQIGPIILWLWAAGSMVFMLRLLGAIWQGQVWVAAAQPARSPKLGSLSKTVRLRKSHNIHSPLVAGLIRPVILVPHDFDLDYSNPETRAVLEHEIAHIRRGDLWVNFAQHLLLAALWWCLPLHWIHRQIATEREKLCDDMAARNSGNGRALASALLSMAEARSRSQNLGRAPGLSATLHPRAARLTDRITRLCNDVTSKEYTMPKYTFSRLSAICLGMPMALAMLVTVSPRMNTASAHPHMGSDWSDINYDRLAPEQGRLYRAVRLGDHGAVKTLMATQMSPNFALEGEGTPLIEAVRQNDKKLASILISHKADANLASRGDGTPLISAAKHGYTEMARYLVDQGADVNLASPRDGNPLIAASQRNRIETARALIGMGANVNAVVIRDETPLINAAQAGHLDMAKLLVKNGADVSLGAWTKAKGQSDNEWRTPISEAGRRGHQEMVDYLISQGASAE